VEAEVAALDLPNANLEVLAAAILRRDMLEGIAGSEPFTLLAPSDRAFAEMDAAYIDSLLSDDAQLEDFVRRHVIPTVRTLSDLTESPVETLSGEVLPVAIQGGSVQLAGAVVLQGDIAVPFGLVHVIDRVLPDPEAAAAAETETATPAATDARTASPSPTALPSRTPAATLTPTIWPAATRTAITTATAPDRVTETATAPTPTATTPMPAATATSSLTLATALAGERDARAFGALVEHAGAEDLLVSGGERILLVPSDGALGPADGPLQTALRASSENVRQIVSHLVIDGVGRPEVVPSGSSVQTRAGDTITITHDSEGVRFDGVACLHQVSAGDGTLCVVDRILFPQDYAPGLMGSVINTQGLTQMAALIALAGLDQELALPASLTLLAPTDEAFDELSAQEMASLTEDLDVLRAFVERHIIDARLLAAELQARTVVTARSGDALAVRGRGSMLIIGGTRVLTKDIAAGAAVIHTVDTVVLP